MLAEADSEQALEIAQREACIAPDLMLAEVANAICSYLRRNGSASIPTRFRLLEAMFTDIVPTAPLVAAALPIAVRLQHPVYDCIYLALAARQRCRLITADRRFLAIVQGTDFEGAVMPLSDWRD